jgi:hypothetical protein
MNVFLNVVNMFLSVHSNFYIKRLPKLCRIWNFNYIYKKINFIIPNEWSKEKLKKVTLGVPFFMNTKKNVFFNF